MPSFNPDGAAVEGSGIFGLPTTLEEAKLAFVPVPWDATASLHGGASKGPQDIFEASMFTELYDRSLGRLYEIGLAMEELDTCAEIVGWNEEARACAAPIIANGGIEEGCKEELRALSAQVEILCRKMNSYVYEHVTKHLNAGKTAALIGGDHSVSLGAIRAYAERYSGLGVLQIDAHCDLRKSFEGFAYSHASVMDNVLSRTKAERIVQVGVRGFCEEELQRVQESNGQICIFFDQDIADSKAHGTNWNTICHQIIDALPDDIYLTIDVDGLDQSLCPHTGTPVPGGLTYQEFIFLLKSIVEAKKRIVGFDVVEVAPGKTQPSWDAIVGAQLLYQTAGWCMRSQSVPLSTERVTSEHVRTIEEQRSANKTPTQTK